MWLLDSILKCSLCIMDGKHNIIQVCMLLTRFKQVERWGFGFMYSSCISVLSIFCELIFLLLAEQFLNDYFISTIKYIGFAIKLYIKKIMSITDFACIIFFLNRNKLHPRLHINLQNKNYKINWEC